MASLSLVTLNVNGLRNPAKRRAIFKSLRKKKPDVIFLQETHSTKEVEKLWSSEWGGKVLFAHGSSGSRGVAVLLPRNSQISVKEYAGEAKGRLIKVQFELEGVAYTLLNAYAPTADRPEDQIAFLDTMEDCVQSSDSPNVIIGGDFNFCIDPERDRSNRPGSDPSHNRHAGHSVRQRFNTFMEELLLLDAWQFHNTATNQFTFRRRAYASRLHYWLISEHLSELIHQSEITPMALSDHSAVSLLLKTVPEHRGPGCWRFDGDLLGNEEFVAAMGDFLDEWRAPDLPSAHSRWDFLKYEIRKFSIDFSRKSRSQAKTRRRELEQALDILGRSNLTHDPDKEEEYLSYKRELAELELAEANKIIFRAKANWAQVGEKPSKYFLNLQKKKTKNQTMSQIYDNDGNLTTDPRKILETTSSFFEKLYCNKPDLVPLDSLDWNALNIPKIQDTSREGLEVPYSEAELLGALKKMNLGKCPGSDGLTVEFYLKFWEALKGPFMESL